MNSFLKTKEHLRDCLAPYSTLSADFTPIIMTQPCCLSCALYQKWHLISSCTWCGLVFTIALWAHSVLTTMKCDPDEVEVWMRECLPFSVGGVDLVTRAGGFSFWHEWWINWFPSISSSKVWRAELLHETLAFMGDLLCQAFWGDQRIWETEIQIWLGAPTWFLVHLRLQLF